MLMFPRYNRQELIKVEGYSVVWCERKVMRESTFSPQNFVWKKQGYFALLFLACDQSRRRTTCELKSRNGNTNSKNLIETVVGTPSVV